MASGTTNATGDDRPASGGTPALSTRAIGYRPELDGLRGVAVFLVLLAHGSPYVFPGGHLGVDVFFALSGFLITKLLVEEFARTGAISFKRFYVRRTLRLLPALLLLLAFYTATVAVAAHREGEPYPTKGHLFELTQVLFYFSNWTRAFDWHPTGNLGHCWSLSIEEQYYLLWPAAFLIAVRRLWSRPRTLLGLFLGFSLVAAVWRLWLSFRVDPARIYNGLDTRADLLVMGGCAAVVFHHWGAEVSRWLARNRAFVRLASVPVLAWLGYSLFDVYWYDPRLGRYLLAVHAVVLSALVLVVACSPGTAENRVLSARPLVFTGKVSYGLYLWHFPVFMYWLPLWWDMGQPWRFPVGVPLTLAFTLASYYMVEQPVLRLKKRFAVPGRATLTTSHVEGRGT